MKFINKLLLFFILFTLSFCNSDDDNDDSPYAGIPEGDIVAVELRDTALSGSASSGGRQLAVGQKWWKDIAGQVRYIGECDGEETKETNLEDAYIAFDKGGTYWIKYGVDGTPSTAGSWQWKDQATKDELFINHAQLLGSTFSLRALNDDEFVYSNEQSITDCTRIIWDQLGNPVFE